MSSAQSPSSSDAQPARTAAADDNSSGPEWTISALEQEYGIKPQPANAIIERFGGWDEFATAAESDADWVLIDGVGPKTADQLSQALSEADAIPGPSDSNSSDNQEEAVSSEVNTEESDEPDEDATEPEVTPDEEEDVTDSHDEEADAGEEDNEQSTEVDKEPEVDEEPDLDGEPNGEAEEEADEDAEEEAGEDDETKVASSFAARMEANVIQTIIGQFTPIADEGRLHLNEDGLNINIVDPANVMMRSGDYPKALFEEWNTSGGCLGVNLDRFADVISMADKDELITLELTSKRRLRVAFDGLEYTLALIDPESIRQEPDIPDLDLTAGFEVQARQIKRANKAADMVSDHVGYEAHGPNGDHRGQIKVVAEGDTDDVDITWEPSEDVTDVTLPSQGKTVDSLYSLDYMKDIIKNVGKDTMFTVRVGDEFPIMLEHTMGDGRGKVTTMLAPRIQSN